MGKRPKTRTKSEYVVPILDTDPEPTGLPPLESGVNIDLLGQLEPIEQNEKISAVEEGEDAWTQFSINLDLSQIKKLAQFNEKLLEKSDKVINVLVVILKVLRLFNSDLLSLSRLLKVVIKQVIKGIQGFIESLISTGLYVNPIIPDFDKRKPGYVLPINAGIGEFKAQFTASCLNKNDPTAPKFGPQDTVGGFVFATGAGVNDPSLLANFIKNLEILAKFFGFKNPLPPPPVNVACKPGYFKDSDGTKKLGVQVTWEHPGDTLSISGFKLYRCKNKEGLKKIVVENNKQVERYVYSDEDFNSGDPYEVSYFPLKYKYKYIDFEVEAEQKYNYQIFSTAGFDFLDAYEFLRSVESPMGSVRVSAVPRGCIPISELKRNNIFDVDGNPVDTSKLGGEWINLTVRDILPVEMGSVFQLLDNFSEAVAGGLDSAGDALTDYIDFLKKKIQKLLDIMRTVVDLVDRILQYRLQGSVLLLNIPPESGGMQNFVDRFNSAVFNEQEVRNLLASSEEDQEAGASIEGLEGIFAGVGIVYGFPEFDSELSQVFVSEEQKDSYKKQLEKFQTSLKTYRQLLGLEE